MSLSSSPPFVSVFPALVLIAAFGVVDSSGSVATLGCELRLEVKAGVRPGCEGRNMGGKKKRPCVFFDSD